MSETKIPREVLQRWRPLSRGDTRIGISRITAGLINDTYLLDDGKTRYVMQCLHRVFKAEVNLDIQAVTEQLILHRVNTPTIIPCIDGQLWFEYEGRVWRLLSYIPGHTVHAVAGPGMAHEAGRIAAVYHAALGDFEYRYRAGRDHVHDTPAHLRRLADALESHSAHRLYSQVEPLAQRILAISDRYGEIDDLPLRHCHGDLKISNILFDDDNKAICLIDLDTVNRMAWPLEMGDALRSWCNPRTEDKPSANFDLAILDAALAGYAEAIPPWLRTAEKQSLITGLARICLELSARFLADALFESYFGWDNSLYPTRGDHNLARGQAMVALHSDVVDKRVAANEIVRNRLIF